MNYEEKILKDLVEAYRRSKKDTGENTIRRRTQIKPERIYKKYHANDGDFEKITEINQTVDRLTDRGFVWARSESFGTDLSAIYLVDESIQEIEAYLSDRYGYVPKYARLRNLESIIQQYKDASPICSKECDSLKQLLEKRQLPTNLDELENNLRAVSFIENNSEKLYLREVSMKVYGDSKFFEENTLRAVCGMLRKHHSQDRADSEMYDEILEKYHIFREPHKFSLKGNIKLRIGGSMVSLGGFSEGIEIAADELPRIEEIHICASVFLTVENRTSYLRYRNKDMAIFYLGGYANRRQRDFIKEVYRQNPDISYLHSGDIDAGGFWIHHHLCEITGVPFGLFAMSVRELSDPAYRTCLRPLTDNDRKRLVELSGLPEYQDVIQYMQDAGVKLEQEIISLHIAKKGEIL